MATPIALLIGALTVMAAVTMTTGSDELFKQLELLHEKLRIADHRLVGQTGGGYVTLCSLHDSDTYYDVIKCLLSPLRGAVLSQVVEITFDYPFLTKPNVAVFTSGFTWTMGADYEVKVIEATPTGMKVEVSSTTLLAIGSVHFNYIACDRELDFPRTLLDTEH